jgi:hypothetical protein
MNCVLIFSSATRGVFFKCVWCALYVFSREQVLRFDDYLSGQNIDFSQKLLHNVRKVCGVFLMCFSWVMDVIASWFAMASLALSY